MANTHFTDPITSASLSADWLNDANNVIYNVLGNGVVSPDCSASANLNLGMLGISVKSCGAVGNGIADDTQAFLEAIAKLQINANFRGGLLILPKGYYRLSASLRFLAYAAGSVHNIFILGEGPDNTVLDFSGCPANSDGISFNFGAHFGVANLCIFGAPNIGLNINPSSIGSSNFCSLFKIHNVRIQSSGSDNFLCTNSFMGEVSNCWSFASGRIGYNFSGFHTSMHVHGCESSINRAHGWSLNGMVYSTFASCGSDSNNARGWSMSNLNSVVFNSIGAEQNSADAIALLTSTASTVGVPSDAQDIHGIVFNACYAVGNGTSSPGSFGSFIFASTADSRPIDFVINGGKASPYSASDSALILSGNSGSISCHKTHFYDAGYTTPDFISGSVEVKNATVIGRTCLVGLASSTVALLNNTLTNLSIAATFVNNALGATISGQTIVIPRGVNKIRLECNVTFAANSVGVRQMFVQKNGVNVIGLPSCTMSAVNSGPTILSLSSSTISCVAGDTFSVQVYQNSGSSLNLLQGTPTYISVEAVC